MTCTTDKDQEECVNDDHDSDTLSEFSLCNSSDELDIVYVLIIVGLIIAAILVVSNFAYWLYTVVKFGYAELPGFLKPLALTGWLVPPLGVLLSCGAEFASQSKLK